jgi:endoglucanase
VLTFVAALCMIAGAAPNAFAPVALADSQPMDVWWPTDGSTVSGVQPFKIMVKNLSVDAYSAFWQVDGDRLNPMDSSQADYPHKEASVDLTGWTWRGRGPYTVTFVAKDASGNTVSTATVHVYNGAVAASSVSSSVSSSAASSVSLSSSSSLSISSSSSTPSSTASSSSNYLSSFFSSYPMLLSRVRFSSSSSKASVSSSSSSAIASSSSVSSIVKSSSSSQAAIPAGGNPFAGAKLYVNPNTDVTRQVDAWRSSRPQDAQALSKISGQPESQWFGNWNSDVASDARSMTDTITNAGALPVYVAYNIPQRDCGGYSAGGSGSPDAYRTWIRNLATGIGSRRAVVLLEPDALAGMDCLSSQDQSTRLSLLKEAVHTFKSQGSIAVYIDAGHSNWKSASDIAARLKQAGIDEADGFVLNISNFETDADTVKYGSDISNQVGGKHFVYDAGRNGNGPTSDHQWCNPPDRAIGQPATVNTGNPLVDAVLWVKGPGGSDGQCNGGPSAGTFWADYALGLAQRSHW